MFVIFHGFLKVGKLGMNVADRRFLLWKQTHI
jgi:hypothetical protein